MSLATYTLMVEQGGSFIKKLAEAWMAADPANRERLEAAFAPEFSRYAEIASILATEVA